MVVAYLRAHHHAGENLVGEGDEEGKKSLKINFLCAFRAISNGFLPRKSSRPDLKAKTKQLITINVGGVGY